MSNYNITDEQILDAVEEIRAVYKYAIENDEGIWFGFRIDENNWFYVDHFFGIMIEEDYSSFVDDDEKMYEFAKGLIEVAIDFREEEERN